MVLGKRSLFLTCLFELEWPCDHEDDIPSLGLQEPQCLGVADVLQDTPVDRDEPVTALNPPITVRKTTGNHSMYLYNKENIGATIGKIVTPTETVGKTFYEI